jgi:hypothetical protein
MKNRLLGHGKDCNALKVEELLEGMAWKIFW